MGRFFVDVSIHLPSSYNNSTPLSEYTVFGPTGLGESVYQDRTGLIIFFLFVLILYILVNNFSVMPGPDLYCLTYLLQLC